MEHAEPDVAGTRRDTCFTRSTAAPGDVFAFIERLQPVRIQHTVRAEYYKPVGELAALRVFEFESPAAAQACQAAIERCIQQARRRPYNPEFTGPFQEGGWRVLAADRYVVWLVDAARGYPTLRGYYATLRGELYTALRPERPAARRR